MEEIPKDPKRDEFLVFWRHRNSSLDKLFTSDHQPPPSQDKQNQDQGTPHKNDTHKGQPKGDMGTITITTISKMPLALIPGNSFDEIIPFDPLQWVLYKIPSLGEYFFIP